MHPISKVIVVAAITAVGLLSCSPENTAQESRAADSPNYAYEDYLYQYSIIDALLAGVYDGNLTIGELKEKGNLGLGGFNGLDGELYMNEGVVYKIRFDGSVHEIPNQEKTPVAFGKRFKADTVVTFLQQEMSYNQFKTRLSPFLNENEIYAIRISGSFMSMTTRAPAPASKPYPPLAKHLENHQHEFDLTSTRGIAVGFYLPAYVDRMNVPGFHFHYLAADKKSGGHVLDFTSDSLKMEIDKAKGIIVENMDSEAFRWADLQKDRNEELEKVE